MHAAWGGRAAVEDAVVLDVFAGTGAFGLEALSRGARFVRFFEQDRAALTALRSNIKACGAERRCEVVAGDALAVDLSRMRTAANDAVGRASLVFLDPPYRQGLVAGGLQRLDEAGLIAPEALVIAELGRDETWRPEAPILDRREHGAAQVIVWRAVVAA
jgi:16S rRNA (guanine966-N2)-methyltransferase